jgi:uncharacterized protein YqgC (DUF456 family)
MTLHTIWPLFVAILLLLPGIVGVVIPVLPGIPYMFLVAIGYAALRGFYHIAGAELWILAGLALASIVVDYLSGTLGARLAGASAKSLSIGLLGLLVGLFILPPLGGVIGLFVGIFLAEFMRHRNQHQALRAATGGLIGSVAGIILNLILALTFMVLFILFAISA